MRNSFKDTQTRSLLTSTALLNENKSLLVEVPWKLDFSFQDFLVNGHWVVVVKGVDSGDGLIKENPECPPVDWLSMALVQKNFRGQVLWSPTNTLGSFIVLDSSSREPEIRNSDVSDVVDENIFGFQADLEGTGQSR